MKRYCAQASRAQAFFALIGGAVLAVMPSPAARAQDQLALRPSGGGPTLDPSRTARIGTAEVGKRQVAPVVDPNLPDPYGRLDNRVPNRVQNRLSNRIDPNYRANIGFADPFRAATSEAEIGKSKKPR